MIKSSITDIPRNVKEGEKDNFGIEPFERGLIRFIESTNTPITIALQGEWGSGKTSLMNSLTESLSKKGDTNARYHSVWLNTWEHALMKDAETTLIEIITGLIREITQIAKVDETQTNKMLKRVWNVGKVASKFVAKTAMDKVVDGSSGILDEVLSSEDKKASIGDIRQELEEIIAQCIVKDNKQGFIFFIDDLDRIDPPVAVELLELLKNIFTIKNCIFVLAIDYDVVVKGLEPKFGKLTASNEREFRSFFDKIIQVPFSMPVSSYRADDFLKESLKSINYLNETQANNHELIVKFSEISNLTVGSNPRALKRLLNSISLISCINAAKGNTDEEDELNDDIELLINFALVSVQIAYPAVYRMLAKFPAFDQWDENVALQYNLKALDNQSIEKLNSLEEFDEEWEKILFRLCENDYYLKKKALNISTLLNKLRTYIKDKNETIEDVISGIISLSSVTSIEADSAPVADVQYHKGNLLKSIRNKLLPVLKNKMPEKANYIQQIGSRIKTNFRFKIDEDVSYGMSSCSKEGQINLGITTGLEYSNDQTLPGFHKELFREQLEKEGLLSEFEKISNDYQTYIKTTDFTARDLYNLTTWRDKKVTHFYVPFNSDLVLPTTEDFQKEENIEKIANHIIKSLEFRAQVKSLFSK